MNDDFLDLLFALLDANARFLVIGAYAVAAHGHPRATRSRPAARSHSMEDQAIPHHPSFTRWVQPHIVSGHVSTPHGVESNMRHEQSRAVRCRTALRTVPSQLC